MYPGAIAAGSDQPGVAQYRKMPGDRALGKGEGTGEMANAQLVLVRHQQFHDAQAHRVGEALQLLENIHAPIIVAAALPGTGNRFDCRGLRDCLCKPVITPVPGVSVK